MKMFRVCFVYTGPTHRGLLTEHREPHPGHRASQNSVWEAAEELLGSWDHR